MLRASRVVVLVVLVGAVSSCGGPIRRDELQRGIQTIASQAAEGGLVADGAASDRTKATFTRVQAQTLESRVAHEAEKLADAQASGDVASARDEAVRLAGNVSDSLGQLEVRPDDTALARRIAHRLRRLDAQAKRLAGRL